MAKRIHYMTMYFWGKIIVTHIKRDWGIEVTFKQPWYKGYKILVTTLDGKILKNKRFNIAEVEWLLRFLKNNASLIEKESNGKLVRRV